jgi:glutathione S-transferase
MGEATTPDQVNFFDINSTLPGTSKSWSPNTLKTRLVLNFKNTPYTQSWISYPDIAPVLSSLDVPANNPKDSPFTHTLPAIQHSSLISPSNPHGVIMDSFAIAEHLDRIAPIPTLFPSGAASYALAVSVNRLITHVIAPGLRVLVPPVAEFLDHKGHEYFVRTRSVKFGTPLGEVRPADQESVRMMVDAVKKEFATVVQMLRGRREDESQSQSQSANRTGPFFEGPQPGYADFIVLRF